MGLGGNPYGPAGTGKTESVKALGSLLGRQVLVFNCDEVSFYRKLMFSYQLYFIFLPVFVGSRCQIHGANICWIG